MRSDKSRLEDILHFINQTASNYDESKYDSDEVFRYGLVKYLEMIGEACRCLSDSTKSMSPNLNWRSIIGFRNIAVHAYHDLDWDSIKTIILSDLPQTKLAIEELIKKLG